MKYEVLGNSVVPDIIDAKAGSCIQIFSTLPRCYGDSHVMELKLLNLDSITIMTHIYYVRHTGYFIYFFHRYT